MVLKHNANTGSDLLLSGLSSWSLQFDSTILTSVFVLSVCVTSLVTALSMRWVHWPQYCHQNMFRVMPRHSYMIVNLLNLLADSFCSCPKSRAGAIQGSMPFLATCNRGILPDILFIPQVFVLRRFSILKCWLLLDWGLNWCVLGLLLDITTFTGWKHKLYEEKEIHHYAPINLWYLCYSKEIRFSVLLDDRILRKTLSYSSTDLWLLLLFVSCYHCYVFDEINAPLFPVT